MQQLKTYDILEDIQRIAYDRDEAKFKSLNDIIPNEESYLKLTTAMIHLEETESCETLRKFNLKNIEMAP